MYRDIYEYTMSEGEEYTKRIEPVTFKLIALLRV